MVYDIDSHWGSHTTMLRAALETLPAGSLVIEHGAGIYSSPVIARHDVRVCVLEELPGWSDWAAWFYENAGREVETLDRAKRCIPRLVDAGLVFIDGAVRERGDLLKWALDANAPIVIAHDTEDDSRKQYGYSSHYFERKGYEVTHDTSHPRTTTWRRIA